MNRHLIIVGRPRSDRQNMTSLLIEYCQSMGWAYDRVDGAPFDQAIKGNSIVVFMSSAPRFGGVLAECRKFALTLVVVSSGIEAGREIPLDVDIPVITAPNLSPLVMITFAGFELMGPMIQKINAERLVAELHQQTKKTPPATAQKLAGYWGQAPETVLSVRDDRVARFIAGVPKTSLAAYGYHIASASYVGTEMCVTFNTQGREAYLQGLTMLLSSKAVSSDSFLKDGINEAHKVVFQM